MLVPYFGFPCHYFFINTTEPIQNFALLAKQLFVIILIAETTFVHNVRFDKFYGVFKLPLGFAISLKIDAYSC